MAHIVIIGTCDTKLHELLYLRTQLLTQGASKITLIDVGRTPTTHPDITISQPTLLTNYSPRKQQQQQNHQQQDEEQDQKQQEEENQDPTTLPRSEFITHMSLCASNWISQTHSSSNPSQQIHGIISAGGTGNTSLVSTALRSSSLPLGFPKLIVSTAASGDTSPIIGESDIILMPSIVDIAGTNSLLCRILSNAAGAMVGMAKSYLTSLSPSPSSSSSGNKKKKIKIALTMFGVTTPAITTIRSHLESTSTHEFEIFIFHATGHGGLAMESLISSGEIDAIIDLTTTEIADYIVGGNMSAGPYRLEAALKMGIPCVISLGALDMVNFGPKSTLPPKFHNRLIYQHNSTVTLMRTSPAENKLIGEYIVEKILSFTSPSPTSPSSPSSSSPKAMVQIIFPKGGLSLLSTPDQPFYDPKADEVLFETIREGLRGCRGVEVVEDERGVNDEGFAGDVAEVLVGLLEGLEGDT
ncbi:related to UPF0261 domain protein [Ramularia collo-cygni]|uniref:Related to UPF0261 domain protein n=1 Tax=Ramularia collo-cygni TaxID=112498 RepID=A0A2D3VBZ4_9PEZI|nr:related to UPF0261 domain protein [Ramularia collo-cygni]CZT24510.1 related to UPF0261 domain protein [Ramularia collo-cygni]